MPHIVIIVLDRDCEGGNGGNVMVSWSDFLKFSLKKLGGHEANKFLAPGGSIILIINTNQDGTELAVAAARNYAQKPMQTR